MPYTVEDLSPANTVLIIDSEEFILSLITLQIEVEFTEKYGSLNKALETLHEQPMEILKIIWILILHKNKFNNSYKEFYNYCFKSNESTAKWSAKMAKCLKICIKKSSPNIKNQQRHKDINDLRATQTEEKPCYAIYFDALSKRYGLTLQNFYQLTLSQLHILLKTSGDKAYDDLEILAKLHGKDLQPRMVYAEISEEEEEDNKNEAMSALDRVNRAHELGISLKELDLL